MNSFRVPGFTARTSGFAFCNWFPPGSPVIDVPTPLGRLALGDANAGLCGGMVFAAMDFYHHGIADFPTTPEPLLYRYFCRRLFDSWNLPFGGLKYYDWQRRPGGTQYRAGYRVLDGLTRKTILNEWPRIRAELHRGRPAALALILARGYSLYRVGRNHQVLCYGYDSDGAAGLVSLTIYDPNHPGEECSLSLRLADPDTEQLIRHSRDGPTVRGFFLTRYRMPMRLPSEWAD